MESPNIKTPALILGNGLTVLGTLRCLAAAKIPSLCLSTGMGFEAASRWFRRAGQRVDIAAGADELSRVLERLDVTRGVLLSCSDHWIVEVARLPADLRERFPSSAPPAGVVERFIDKAAFAALLEEVGVPHPRTVLVEDESALDHALDEFRGAYFLKPVQSQHFLREFHVKAFRVDDTDEARERYREARGAGLSVMLQEYVPGPPDRHYFVDGFVDREHRVAAVFARRRLRMHPADFGNSSHLVSVPVERVSGAVESLRAVFARARYRGIFSAEFKLDERDGEFKLIEINCRPWWYVEFAARCGVNIVEMAYRDALDLPLAGAVSYRSAERLVYGYYDYFACRRALDNGELTIASWMRSWFHAHKAVFRIDDPAPALASLLARMRSRAARRR